MEWIDRFVLTYLANALWIGCVVLVAAVLAARMIHESPSSHKHVLWASALVLASLLPLLAPTGHDGLVGFRGSSPAEGAPRSTGRIGGGPTRASFLPEISRRTGPISLAPPLSEILAGAYVIFVGFRAAKLVRAFRRTLVIARESVPAPLTSRQKEVVGRLQWALDAGRVSIETSSMVDSPVVLGVWSRILVLPEWFAATTSEDEFASTIWHELAHVRRHDFLLNLVCEVLLLPLAFHPAAIAIKRQIERSRELACDEFAAGNLPTRTVYARSLLSIARSIAATSPAARSGCAVGMFAANSLEERIVRLLRGENPRGGRRRSPRAAAASGLLAAACLIACAFSIEVDASPAADQFAGLWEAQVGGRTIATLRLAAADGRLSGTLQGASLDAALQSSSKVVGSKALAGRRVEGSPEGRIVHLVAETQGKAGATAFRLRLLDPSAVELEVESAPATPGAPATWTLVRKGDVVSGCTAGGSAGSVRSD